MGSIGVIAAMPQEIAPLLRRVGPWRKEVADGFNLYRFELGGVPVALVESGMGPLHASWAAAVLIERAAPALLLNYGFAGGVLPDLRVGDLVLAERVYFLKDGRLAAMPEPDRHLGEKVWNTLAAAASTVRRGAFITARVITSKNALAQSLEPELAHPVLEMETAAVLRVAAEAGIPVVALRAVSDAADEELGFSLEEFCDDALRIRGSRVFLTIARKPWIIPQLLRLSGNTNRAGKILAQGVELALRALSERVLVESPLPEGEG